MNTQERKFDIVNGPSRDQLIDAFKYAYSKQTQVPVKFRIVLIYTEPGDDPNRAHLIMLVDDFLIASLQHEDSSGYSFNVQGCCKANLRIGMSQLESHKFNMHYNAKTRKGTIEFEKA